MKTVVWFGFGLLGSLFGSLFGSLCAATAAAGRVTVTKPGETITLPCGVDRFRNSLEWKHGNELISNVDKRGFVRKGRGDTAQRSSLRNTQLRIRNVKESDAGRFTCKADGTTHAHTVLVVSTSAGSSDDFLLGSEVTLQCEVKGLDPEPAVQWLRPDGRPHTGSETVQLKSASDSGTWLCTFSHEGATYSQDHILKSKSSNLQHLHRGLLRTQRTRAHQPAALVHTARVHRTVQPVLVCCWGSAAGCGS